MPSLFNSAPSGSSGSRVLSKVNSFKRTWEDDGEDSNQLKGSSEAFEWEESPERVKRKGILVAYPEDVPPPPQPIFDPNETAADRRRKAILASMSDAASNIPSSASTATSTLRSSTQIKSQPTGQRIPAAQNLPSIPARVSQKRALPWEEDVGNTKAMRTASATSAGSDGSKRSKSGGSSTGGVMSIAQKVSLSVEQQRVLSLVVSEGKNIFFTGSAGTGKSVLLREIIKALRKKYATSPDAVAVTASTGIAACNIGGVTLHSFGGVGLGVEDTQTLVSRIKKNKKASARWLRTKVLIVDEISMVDGALFDKLCKIGQMMRKVPGKPFGGIQIVATGDFFQLPPVTKGNQSTNFCFEAATWNETINMSVNLTKVFRQKDQTFVDMLNEMRFGAMKQSSIDTFKRLSREIRYTDGLSATELFPRREDVDKSNLSRLNGLNTDGWSYNAIDSGTVDPVQREKLLSNFMAPKHISIKQDAQVMLIKNMDESLVNGSMGIVQGFCHKALWDVDFNGKWIKSVNVDDLCEEEREKKEKARALVESKMAGTTPLPVVRFKVPGGFRDQIIDFEQFKVELPNGEIQAARTQLPLILAWAMSIHKSQGQTLERVKVDLSKVFEKGQAYVALSRATSLEGLQVLGFNASKVLAHPKVKTWSSQLRDLNT